MTKLPTPAATLILIRETAAQPVQTLMVERAAALAFGGALVFPGGRIDPADVQLAEPFADPLAAARIAAIRETLEETAIPAGLAPLPSPEAARQIQAELHAGRDFAAVLAERQLALALDELVHFARWQPPAHLKRRFDTHFFVAAAPAGEWQPLPQEGECIDAQWLTVAEVERRTAEGSARLAFPTRCNLRRIGQHSTYAAVKADAERHPVQVIEPTAEERDGHYWVTIAAGHGYPASSGRSVE